jgi:hypothetical protein
MPFVEEKKFRYPAEEECLVRRLGSAVIVSWSKLPNEAQDKILAEAKAAWDRSIMFRGSMNASRRFSNAPPRRGSLAWLFLAVPSVSVRTRGQKSWPCLAAA